MGAKFEQTAKLSLIGQSAKGKEIESNKRMMLRGWFQNSVAKSLTMDVLYY